MKVKFLTMIAVLLISAYLASGQTTEFTYQGRLLDSNLPPTAVYDFEFSLWDALANGTQAGTTQTVTGVAVANGIFTVRLNFGAQFNGATRFLQIAVRGAGGGVYTSLAPRQPITSAPYAIRSLNSTTADTATNALNLDGVPASQYVVTTDPRMADARNPLAGSANYIQNQNAAPQAASNFNISNTGTASIFNATTQFNIGGNRVFSIPGTNNTFAGINAGAANATGMNLSFFGRNAGAANLNGNGNSFFGGRAGQSTLDGSFNSFFGFIAGRDNNSGSSNSFFGSNVGIVNTEGSFNTFVGDSAGTLNTASYNSFFGYQAGWLNSDGTENAFFGRGAGAANTTSSGNSFFGHLAGTASTGGNNAFFGAAAGLSNNGGLANSFFGRQAGAGNISGNSNVFVGYLAGAGNTIGSGNTLLGFNTRVGAGNLINATALGSQAQVDCSDCLVLGAVSGVNGGTSSNVGIGTTTPETRLEVVNNGGSGAHVFTTSYGAVNNAIIGRQASGTLNNPTATTNGLALLFLGGRGHTGSGFATVSRAGIGLEASENWTTTDNGTRLTFDTTENNTTTRLERMRIDHNGRVGIGTTTPSTRLHVFDAAPSGGVGVIYGATTSTAVNAYAVVGEIISTSPGGGSAAVLGNNRGTGSNGIGVFGDQDGEGWGVYGQSTEGGIGVRGFVPAGGAGYAGYFNGNVLVTGTLAKGGGAFKIDHPLDPANKYLWHSFVESPDMKNIYDGNVMTNAENVAEVVLPDWFESLNRDFRYQLTVIGQFAQAIVAEKIKGNRFKIRTNLPYVEVSWQVTGIRRDGYAEKNRIPVEEDKPAIERGTYLHPEAFDQPEEKGVEWARNPELMKMMKERREQAKQPSAPTKADNEKPQQ